MKLSSLFTICSQNEVKRVCAVRSLMMLWYTRVVYYQPDQSGRQGSVPDYSPPLECHDKGSHTQLGLLHLRSWRLAIIKEPLWGHMEHTFQSRPNLDTLCTLSQLYLNNSVRWRTTDRNLSAIPIDSMSQKPQGHFTIHCSHFACLKP